MRIRLRRSGGFAGLQAPPVELDSQQLPPDRARELDELLAAARLFGPEPAAPGAASVPAAAAGTSAAAAGAAGAAAATPAAAVPPPLARDGFQYDLTVEDGGGSRAVRLHEGAMRPEAARLVRWLTEEAGRK